MKSAGRLLTAILVALALYGGLMLGQPAGASWWKSQEQQAAKQREQILRRVFIGRQLNLQHFPPGVYTFHQGGTAAAMFESEDGPLESLYRRLAVPAHGGAAIKFLIRENGNYDFATRGAIQGGGDTRENRLISDRICTALNENPRIGQPASDDDTRRVQMLIFSALRQAVHFRREKYLIPMTGRVPPLEITREGNTFVARYGAVTLRLLPDGDFCTLVSLHAEDGTVETEILEAFPAGSSLPVWTVERAMVNESVVGTVIPIRINGFAGPMILEAGVDNGERLTGIAILDHMENRGFADPLLTDGTDFIRQFEGLLINDMSLKGEAEGGIVDSVSGATRTCRGVTAGVRDALRFYERLNAEEYGQESTDASE